MDIFIIRHNWDNGLSFEDKERYQEDKYYSTKTAAVADWSKIGPFEGMYTLLKVTLNTQETEIIEQTQYNRCSNYYEQLNEEYQEELAKQQALEDDWFKMMEEQITE